MHVLIAVNFYNFVLAQNVIEISALYVNTNNMRYNISKSFFERKKNIFDIFQAATFTG